MTTVIECTRRYLSERAAVADIPHMATPGFRVAVYPSRRRDACTGEWRDCEEYRLQLYTERPVPVLKALKRAHPDRTFVELGAPSL